MNPRSIQQAYETALQHHQAGRLVEAEQMYRQILLQQPQHPEAVHYLGVIAHQTGRRDVAMQLISQAVALRPDYAEALNNLGVVLRECANLQQAIDACQRAIKLCPAFPAAFNNLGNALLDSGRLDEAVGAYSHAIALQPGFADAYSNLGNAFKGCGMLEEAIAAYRRAIEIEPGFALAHSNLIFAMHLCSAHDAATVAKEARHWDQRHAAPLRHLIRAHTNNPDTNRRLRIGYVSPDFKEHVVGRTLLPVLRLRDSTQVEIFCYSQTRNPDSITHQLEQSCDGWRNIAGQSDQLVVSMIREDRIDVLVDLALHSGDNRLIVFAQKPAPVQVTYLGYGGTTGLSTMDYRISDPYLDPPAIEPDFYSEKTIRLSRSYWCYTPHPNAPAVGSLPAKALDHVTFASLNNPAKVSAHAQEVWAGLLRELPNSRLLLHTAQGNHRRSILDRFAKAGVSAHRIEFVPSQPVLDYLRTYNRVDVALDPFPFAGGITSCDTLWMGVPLVTLAGTQSGVSRGGCSVLGNLGLSDLIASDPDSYISIAVGLARDLTRLAELRNTLRERMRQSPLLDPRLLARDLERVYRIMWHEWCKSSVARS